MIILSRERGKKLLQNRDDSILQQFFILPRLDCILERISMFYIVTALYEEALPFLEKYRLKRKTDFPHFELFIGEEAMLLITRPGALRAATALSSVLTAFPPQDEDFLLSVGCAGCILEEKLGEAFIISKITEGASGRVRYPELLFRCPFQEAEVITEAKIQVIQKPPERKFDYFPEPLLLYDMEAAGVYEAAIPYFSCERLLFVKVISDPLTGLLELSMEERRRRITDNIVSILPVLEPWLAQLNDFFKNFSTNHFRKSMLIPEGEILFTRLCTALHLSTASSLHLRQLMLYLTLSEIPYVDSMKKLLATLLETPYWTKKEGLQYLGELYEYYLSAI